MEGRFLRVVLFQITIAEKHPISGPALSKVWSALPKEVKKVDPAIVFVVPHDKAAGYKNQNIEGATDGPANMATVRSRLDGSVLWPGYCSLSGIGWCFSAARGLISGLELMLFVCCVVVASWFVLEGGSRHLKELVFGLTVALGIPGC